MSVYRVVSEQSSRVMNVRTVPEMGWAGVQNGELLSLAAATFDVLLTVDSSIEYQQDVPAFEISVMVLRARSLSDWSHDDGEVSPGRLTAA